MRTFRTNLFVVMAAASAQEDAWRVRLRAVPPISKATMNRLIMDYLVIEGHKVSLDNFTVSTGKTHVTYTRARVATTSAHRLHVSREHFLSGMAKALGAQDVQVGDAAYDERFQIKSDDEAWARRVLAAPIRKQHLEDAKLQLRVHKGWVETFAEGFDLDADTLVRRMRLTAALAFSVGE